MAKSIYNKVITSKTGIELPVLINGQTIDSKYDPDKESDKIVSMIDDDMHFFIIIGVGSGKLLEKLIIKYKECKIIALEINDDDLNFLSQLKLINKLLSDNRIIFTSLLNLKNNIINNYIPAIYGKYKIIENKNWISFNKNYISTINDNLTNALNIVSADYSVQCHFGKIWQSNIMNNLKLLFDNPYLSKLKINNNKVTTKTAVIVAAGPSLDESIIEIKSNLNKEYIIATDTAYPVLLKNNVIPDVVIVIDGQNISHLHFSQMNNRDKTLFLLDLCSSNSIGEKLTSLKANILYFISGHPLSEYINLQCENQFMRLFSGAGTVTISALDYANKMGFTNIIIYGADFSYRNGKSYAKGTYFDSLFGETSTKIKTVEKNYSKLMYRSELINIKKNIYTTTLLKAYESSFVKYLDSNNFSFTKENNKYVVTRNNLIINNIILQNPSIKYQSIIKTLKNKEQTKIPLLPFIAWLRAQKTNYNNDISELLKLAHSHLVSYN